MFKLAAEYPPELITGSHKVQTEEAPFAVFQLNSSSKSFSLETDLAQLSQTTLKPGYRQEFRKEDQPVVLRSTDGSDISTLPYELHATLVSLLDVQSALSLRMSSRYWRMFFDQTDLRNKFYLEVSSSSLPFHSRYFFHLWKNFPSLIDCKEQLEAPFKVPPTKRMPIHPFPFLLNRFARVSQ